MVTQNGARPFLKIRVKEPMFTTFSIMETPEKSGGKKVEISPEKS